LYQNNIISFFYSSSQLIDIQKLLASVTYVLNPENHIDLQAPKQNGTVHINPTPFTIANIPILLACPLTPSPAPKLPKTPETPPGNGLKLCTNTPTAPHPAQTFHLHSCIPPSCLCCIL
jgi:hypothetical protein